MKTAQEIDKEIQKEIQILMELLINISKDMIEDAVKYNKLLNAYIIDSGYYEKIKYIINKIAETGCICEKIEENS